MGTTGGWKRYEDSARISPENKMQGGGYMADRGTVDEGVLPFGCKPYERKHFTKEEVYTFVKDRFISKETAIKLIENYGLWKAGEAIGKMRKESGIEFQEEEEFEAVIDRINRRLDKALENIVEHRPGKKEKGSK
jgi:hypothetical protein